MSKIFVTLIASFLAIGIYSQVSIYTDPKIDFIKLGQYEEYVYYVDFYRTEKNLKKDGSEGEIITWSKRLKIEKISDTSQFNGFSMSQKVNDSLIVKYNYHLIEEKKVSFRPYQNATGNLDFFRIVTVGRGSSDVNFGDLSATGGSIFCFSGGSEKQWDLGVGFDLGRISDTISLDEFRLNNLFINDNRSVISAYISVDILRKKISDRKKAKNRDSLEMNKGLLQKMSYLSISNVKEANKTDYQGRVIKYGMQWMTTCPTIEFQYKAGKTVFTDIGISPYQSETLHFMTGIKHWWRYQNETNRMGFLVYPNFKYVRLLNSPGDFISTQYPNQSAKGIYNKFFLGMIMGIQYNELLFTVNYNQNKRIVLDNQNFGGSIFSVGVAFNLNVLSL